MNPINPADLANWLRIGTDVAKFLAVAIPKLVELFHKSDADEKKAMDALDLALSAMRTANDIRLREKHRAVAVPTPSEFDEPTGEEGDDV